MKSLERGITDWAYVKLILNEWKEKGITTLKEAWLEEVEFRKNKLRRQSVARGVQSVVPDWFEERRQQRIQQEKQKQQKIAEELNRMCDPHVVKKEEEELAALLKSICER